MHWRYCSLGLCHLYEHVSWALIFSSLSRDNDIEECGLELYFAADFEVLGKVEQHELKAEGADVRVTDENKEEYIE